MKAPAKSEKKPAKAPAAPKSGLRTPDEAKAASAKKPAGEPVNKIDGPHITQTKPTLGEGLAQSGGNATLDDIGKGSVVEQAPEVRGTSAETSSDRVVQQGDEVILHSRNPVNGSTENHGKVLKINQDQTIAVRVPRADGNGMFDFSPVYNRQMNGELFWSWPEKDTLDADRKAD